MIDIHSHLLTNIDDGSKSLDESLTIIKRGIELGVTDIVVTPHYIFGSSYNANNNVKMSKFKELSKAVKEANLKVNLFLGNEVFVENNLLELLEKGEITTLNQSKYLLFELPMRNEFIGLTNLIFNLKRNGYTPVLAHPERYDIFKNNPTLINDLLDRGLLLQSNIGSFTGQYGKEAEKLVKMLVKHNMISFLGSDVHLKEHITYNSLEEVNKYLEKNVDSTYMEDILHNNALRALQNKEVVPAEYTYITKNIFGYK